MSELEKIHKQRYILETFDDAQIQALQNYDILNTQGRGSFCPHPVWK